VYMLIYRNAEGVHGQGKFWNPFSSLMYATIVATLMHRGKNLSQWRITSCERVRKVRNTTAPDCVCGWLQV